MLLYFLEARDLYKFNYVQRALGYLYMQLSVVYKFCNIVVTTVLTV